MHAIFKKRTFCIEKYFHFYLFCVTNTYILLLTYHTYILLLYTMLTYYYLHIILTYYYLHTILTYYYLKNIISISIFNILFIFKQKNILDIGEISFPFIHVLSAEFFTFREIEEFEMSSYIFMENP